MVLSPQRQHIVMLAALELPVGLGVIVTWLHKHLGLDSPIGSLLLLHAGFFERTPSERGGSGKFRLPTIMGIVSDGSYVLSADPCPSKSLGPSCSRG